MRPTPRRASWPRRTVRRAPALLLLAAASAAVLPARAEREPVRVLVRFDAGLGATERGALDRHDGRLRQEIALRRGSVAAVELPADQVEALRREPGVAYVEDDALRFPAGLATSELVPTATNGLYGLVLTRAVLAQARKVDGKGVAVCVVDSGVDARHEDLVGVYKGGVDLVDNDDDPDVGPNAALGSHGTMVDGIIAAALNGKGVRGVAYGASIYHGRALGAQSGRVSDIMAAAQVLVDRYGCKILNLSLGGETFSQSEQDFYHDLVQSSGVLVVAAAGNDGAAVSYPAAYPDVVAVGAVDQNAAHASFSDTGPQVALSGPGVGVLSSVPRGSGIETTLTVGKRTVPAIALQGSGLTPRKGLVRKLVVDCGTGNTADLFPRSVRGQIALVHRDRVVTFADKVQHAIDAGAVAAIVANDVDEDLHGLLTDPTAADGKPWIPAVAVRASDAASLAHRRTLVTLINGASDWSAADGTSFAAPHVAGVAALVWSVAPDLDRAQVLDILERTAQDLGDPGRDPVYGFGLVDADAATREAAGAR